LTDLFLLLAVLCSLFHLTLMFRVWRAWHNYVPVRSVSQAKVSIVIAARNEAENIEACLAHVFSNLYAPGYEVIVVDDRSEDESPALLRQLASQYPNLQVIRIDTLPQGMPPKKHALTVGIGVASSEILLFTDADCRVPSDWVVRMASSFEADTEVVLGSGPYHAGHGVLNRLIRYETLHTAFWFLGRAKMGNPYMALGRNLAYRKSFFERVGGFASGIESLSGDDDLLVNHHAVGSRTRVVMDVLVYSEPKRSWKAWYRQKLRHLQAGKWYRSGSMRYSSMALLSWIGVWLATFANPTLAGFGVLAVFLLIRGGMLHIAGRKERKVSNIFVILPLIDCLLLLYHVFVIPVAGLIRNPKWN
jgi:cellulose synthase/poly-beta-1,6-N-acetylglucosamine synthase-like glycosyltransferase